MPDALPLPLTQPPLPLDLQLPLTKKVDVAVIDEIQMLGDVNRGWAWTRALLVRPAAAPDHHTLLLTTMIHPTWTK